MSPSTPLYFGTVPVEPSRDADEEFIPSPFGCTDVSQRATIDAASREDRPVTGPCGELNPSGFEYQQEEQRVEQYVSSHNEMELTTPQSVDRPKDENLLSSYDSAEESSYPFPSRQETGDELSELGPNLLIDNPSVRRGVSSPLSELSTLRSLDGMSVHSYDRKDLAGFTTQVNKSTTLSREEERDARRERLIREAVARMKEYEQSVMAQLEDELRQQDGSVIQEEECTLPRKGVRHQHAPTPLGSLDGPLERESPAATALPHLTSSVPDELRTGNLRRENASKGISQDQLRHEYDLYEQEMDRERHLIDHSYQQGHTRTLPDRRLHRLLYDDPELESSTSVSESGISQIEQASWSSQSSTEVATNSHRAYEDSPDVTMVRPDPWAHPLERFDWADEVADEMNEKASVKPRHAPEMYKDAYERRTSTGFRQEPIVMTLTSVMPGVKDDGSGELDPDSSPSARASHTKPGPNTRARSSQPSPIAARTAGFLTEDKVDLLHTLSGNRERASLSQAIRGRTLEDTQRAPRRPAVVDEGTPLPRGRYNLQMHQPGLGLSSALDSPSNPMRPLPSGSEERRRMDSLIGMGAHELTTRATGGPLPPSHPHPSIVVAGSTLPTDPVGRQVSDHGPTGTGGGGGGGTNLPADASAGGVMDGGDRAHPRSNPPVVRPGPDGPDDDPSDSSSDSSRSDRTPDERTQRRRRRRREARDMRETVNVLRDQLLQDRTQQQQLIALQIQQIQRKEGEEKRARDRKNLKIPEPEKYDGQADMDVLEKFILDLEFYFERGGAEKHEMVRLTLPFLKGNAQAFYLSSIQPYDRTISFDDAIRKLAQHVFPSDYMPRLRDRWANLYQKDKETLDEYLPRFERIEKRLSEVTERAKAIRFWTSCRLEFRKQWALSGYSQDYSSFEELLAEARRTERAEMEVKAETDRTHRRRGRDDEPREKEKTKERSRSERYQDRKKPGRDRESDAPRNRDRTDRKEPRSYDSKKTADSGHRDRPRPPRDSKPSSSSGNRLSNEDFAKYRSEGRCFLCGSKDHMKPDCPKKGASVQLKSMALGSATLPSLGAQDSHWGIPSKTSLAFKAVRLSLNAAAPSRNKLKSQRAPPEHRSGSVRKMKANDSPSEKELSFPMMRLHPKTIPAERQVVSQIVLNVTVDGERCLALLDSGSQTDCISGKFVDLARMKKIPLEEQISLDLAIGGTKGKITYGVYATIEWEGIRAMHYFDVVNLGSVDYSIVLGTGFMYQYGLSLTINPFSVRALLPEGVPLEGPRLERALGLKSIEIGNQLQVWIDRLWKEAEDLTCEPPNELPPWREVNHKIPLIDETAKYPYRPAKCAEAYKSLFREKDKDLIEKGIWRPCVAPNAMTLLVIPKKADSKGQLRIRTPIDARIRNENTHSMSTPLPDISEILFDACRHPYRSLIDLVNAFEWTRIELDDVWKTAFTTINGVRESLVMQIGDKNAPATHQASMHAIFRELMGKCVHVYLDDILIFSNTAEEHVSHLRQVFEVLRKARFWVGKDKCTLFADDLPILGHLIRGDKIFMDPGKVDRIISWKAPTNSGELSTFIGAAAYLADDVDRLRIPMAVLNPLKTPGKFKWTPICQQAFEEMKRLVSECRERGRVAMKYGPDAPPIWVITDACAGGAAGYIAQGDEWDKAAVVLYWSGRFNDAQVNYTVTDQEMLGVIETIKRFESYLLGTKFTVLTDHKSSTYLLTQKNLSPRQSRWVEYLSQFEVKFLHIAGETNVLADALSREFEGESTLKNRPAEDRLWIQEDDMTKAERSLIKRGRLSLKAVQLRRRVARATVPQPAAPVIREETRLSDLVSPVLSEMEGGSDDESEPTQSSLPSTQPSAPSRSQSARHANVVAKQKEKEAAQEKAEEN